MNVCDYEIRQKINKSTIDEILFLFDFFRKEGINVFARDGLLLGCIRHKGFLPFDADPDIGILAEDYHKLKVPKGYVLDAKTFTPRNIKYRLKTGIPYDFSIKRKTYNTRYIILLLIVVVTLFTFGNSYKTVLIITLLLIFFIYILESQGVTVLDGTIYPKGENGYYYQEVEKGELHVFNKDYGHSVNEKHFQFYKDDVLPLKQSQFYHGTIAVPQNSKKILIDHYGPDVFKVMYKKEDSNMVKINIENCIPPPAQIV